MKILYWLLFGSGWLIVNAIPLQAQTDVIPLQVDYAVFKADSQKVFLELYLQFPQNKLTFSSKDTLRVASFRIHYQVLQGEKQIAAHQKQFRASLAPGQHIKAGRQFLDAQVFELPAASYRVKVEVKDLQSGNSGEYELNLHLSPFDEQKLSLSDIELCSRIIKKATQTAFSKNQFTVIPNPACLYGIQIPVVYYYAEVYNLSFSPNQAGQYTTQVTITDLNGKVVRQYPPKTHSTPGKSAVLVGGYNVLALPAGIYLLKLKVTDLPSGQSIVKSRKFTLIKPMAHRAKGAARITSMDSRQLLAHYYQRLDESQLDDEFEKMSYIVTPDEKKIYQQLDVQGKRKFLVEFWSKRDPNPKTPQNEFRNEYFKRVNYANAQWGSPRKPGWQTDRGRVYIKYGPPSEIQRYDMAIQQKPIEIWYYDSLEGGVYFIFADLTGYGDYQLMHSTYSKEIHQPEWERFIRPVPTQENMNFPR